MKKILLSFFVLCSLFFAIPKNVVKAEIKEDRNLYQEVTVTTMKELKNYIEDEKHDYYIILGKNVSFERLYGPGTKLEIWRDALRVQGKKILDLNGYTISANVDLFDLNRKNSVEYITVKEGATLVVEDSSSDNTGTIKVICSEYMYKDNIDNEIFVVEKDAKLIVNGGKFLPGTSESEHGKMSTSDSKGEISETCQIITCYWQLMGTSVKVLDGGYFAANGGTFYGRGLLWYGSGTKARNQAIDCDGRSTVRINGGTFYGKGAANCFKTNDNTDIYVNGGTFKTDSVDRQYVLTTCGVYAAYSISPGNIGLPKRAYERYGARVSTSSDEATNGEKTFKVTKVQNYTNSTKNSFSFDDTDYKYFSSDGSGNTKDIQMSIADPLQLKLNYASFYDDYCYSYFPATAYNQSVTITYSIYDEAKKLITTSVVNGLDPVLINSIYNFQSGKTYYIKASLVDSFTINGKSYKHSVASTEELKIKFVDRNQYISIRDKNHNFNLSNTYNYSEDVYIGSISTYYFDVTLSGQLVGHQTSQYIYYYDQSGKEIARKENDPGIYFIFDESKFSIFNPVTVVERVLVYDVAENDKTSEKRVIATAELKFIQDFTSKPKVYVTNNLDRYEVGSVKVLNYKGDEVTDALPKDKLYLSSTCDDITYLESIKIYDKNHQEIEIKEEEKDGKTVKYFIMPNSVVEVVAEYGLKGTYIYYTSNEYMTTDFASEVFFPVPRNSTVEFADVEFLKTGYEQYAWKNLVTGEIYYNQKTINVGTDIIYLTPLFRPKKVTVYYHDYYNNGWQAHVTSETFDYRGEFYVLNDIPTEWQRPSASFYGWSFNADSNHVDCEPGSKYTIPEDTYQAEYHLYAVFGTAQEVSTIYLQLGNGNNLIVGTNSVFVPAPGHDGYTVVTNSTSATNFTISPGNGESTELATLYFLLKSGYEWHETDGQIDVNVVFTDYDIRNFNQLFFVQSSVQNDSTYPGHKYLVYRLKAKVGCAFEDHDYQFAWKNGQFCLGNFGVTYQCKNCGLVYSVVLSEGDYDPDDMETFHKLNHYNLYTPIACTDREVIHDFYMCSWCHACFIKDENGNYVPVDYNSVSLPSEHLGRGTFAPDFELIDPLGDDIDSNKVSYTHSEVCTKCHEIIDGTTNLHTYGEDGKCTVCGYVKPCEHVFGDWELIQKATCQQIGILECTCTKCHITITQTFEKTDHHLITVESKASTCKTKGYATFYYCEDCHGVYNSNEGELIEHLVGYKDSIEEAKKLFEYANLDLNNHEGELRIENEVIATSTTDGYSGDVYCSTCNALIEKGEVIKAHTHGHDEDAVPKYDENGHYYLCDVYPGCGEKLEYEAHTFSSEKDEDNNPYEVCTKCGYVKGENLNAIKNIEVKEELTIKVENGEYNLKDLIEKAADENEPIKIVIGEDGEIIFDEKAVKQLATQNPVIKVSIISGNLLAANIANARLIIEVELTGGTFDEGEAIVTVNFNQKPGKKETMHLYYVDAAGNKEDIDYEYEYGTVKFVANHFSTYAICFDKEKEHHNLWWIIVLIVLGLALIAFVVALILYKKKIIVIENKKIEFKKPLTILEAYAALTKEERLLFDELKAYAAGKENARVSESKQAFTIFIKKEKLLKLEIKKGVIEALFYLVDQAFKEQFAETNTEVKEKATIIKVQNKDDLELAKKTIDLKFSKIEESK